MIKISNLSLMKKIPEISDLDMEIREGETYVLLSTGRSATDHLVNIFLGMEKNFEGSVQVENIDILSKSESWREHLTFLSSGSEWPRDMDVGELLSFLKFNFNISETAFAELYVKSNMERLLPKKISELKEVEWRKFLFSICRLKKGKNFIIRDFVKGMPPDFTLEFSKGIRQMKKDLCSILYLGDDVFFALEIGDRIGFMKKGKLLLELPASRMKKMNIDELYFQFLSEGG